MPDAGGCSGPENPAVFQLTGNNAYVPRSAQGFTYASSGARFILLSNRERRVCRDPVSQPNIDEDVLIISDPFQGAAMLELLRFTDAGVSRTEVQGTTSLELRDGGLVGTVKIDASPLKLEGSIVAPLCGSLR